jgi:hypothetical protein
MRVHVATIGKLAGARPSSTPVRLKLDKPLTSTESATAFKMMALWIASL